MDLIVRAHEFIAQYHNELGYAPSSLEKRIMDVTNEINNFNTYKHTEEELNYGAKLAWRNSNKCIGRLFWDSLHVFDERNLTTEEEIFQSLINHIKFATNGGKIRSTATIFSPKYNNHEVRIWNHQLIRYAGYETDEGVIGDPHSVPFTKECIQLGWTPNMGSFDLLPIVIQINDQEPKLFELPRDIVKEVELEHPRYEWFKDLELKWYAVPFLSDMELEIGGIQYNAAPFNGWYMVTEIGSRNLADVDRYNLLPVIAEQLGLDVSSNLSFWKDHTLLVLNEAVLHSFNKAGVTMVDHHAAAKQFKQFENKEQKLGRCPTGDWTWLVPPTAGATTHIFHKEYKNEVKCPNFFYQNPPY
ncbi:nitric oxide synthase [Halalkalibacillus sediminis]|uniref:Nitric oxide synthase oxygenase n=1 Tax=Halalkalibacillus sediminis TaxID=2018042 RepID=A0A2I0QWS0_9BACI|nr:nitric oxide synthase oxygenase [Halalkalibacillus sediminis]PKR78749.1 nitric oxide synthase [Halalkalibacillus sediminis]